MDESAVLSQLSNLETLRGSLHSALRFWEWMVVLGLFIDAVVIVKEYWDNLQDFRRATIHMPERPSVLLLVLGLLGTGLIAFGISKELSIDSKIEGVETQIRKFNEQLYGIVSQEAENASMKSQSASDKSDVADAKAVKSQEKADAVGTQADKLNRQLLLAKTQLETMEKASFARHLKQKDFAEKLEPLKGFPVAIETIADFEAERTAALIRYGIHEAKWQVGPIVVRTDPASVVDFFFPGVWVENTCGPNEAIDFRKSSELWKACSEASALLVKELGEYGIEAHARGGGENLPKNMIRVRVSLKPMPGEPVENLIVTAP
jgi:hypothetical protein